MTAPHRPPKVTTTGRRAALSLASLGPLAVLALSAVLLTGCGEGVDDTKERVAPPSPSPGPDSDLPPVVPLTFSDATRARLAAEYDKRLAASAAFAFDESLSPDQRALLQNDLLWITSKVHDASAAPGAALYRAAFGTADAAGVLRYLGERVKVFLGAEPRMRLVEEDSGGEGAGDGDDAEGPSTPRLVSEGVLAQKGDDAFLTAQNYGTLTWYWALQKKSKATALGLNESYPVRSMRDGLVSVLPGYTNLVVRSDASKGRLSSPATLVHEARHSDCTVALSPADVSRIRNTGDFLKGNTRCGHLHVVCPSNHKLAGKNACDDHRWGAYEIAGLYNEMVAETCSNCDEEEIAASQYAALEAYSRLLVDRAGAAAAGPALPDMGHVEPGRSDQ